MKIEGGCSRRISTLQERFFSSKGPKLNLISVSLFFSDMVKSYCRVNVEAIFAHPRNCAQYYDCRQVIGGSYLRECRYPQLFDERGICRNFSEVNCGERTEPEAPCKLFSEAKISVIKMHVVY